MWQAEIKQVSKVDGDGRIVVAVTVTDDEGTIRADNRVFNTTPQEAEETIKDYVTRLKSAVDYAEESSTLEVGAIIEV